MKVSQAL